VVDASTRTAIAALLTSKPADAVASYFALEHDAKRTQVTVSTNPLGQAVAFVAVCQTGIDLFRPLVVMRGDDTVALQDALCRALVPGRQYLLSAPLLLRADIEQVAHVHGETINRIHTLQRADFAPIVNVLVQTSRTPDGLLRAGIRARDGGNAAEAGTVWISSRYAEVYVQVAEAVRNRGLGKSVVSAVSAQVLDMGRTPVYIASQDNTPSQRLALRLGYRDTGSLELSGALSLR
jgi:GNAT superfamily N-acetyltransferase